MNELIRQLYGSYAPDIELSDAHVNEINSIYGSNFLKFVNDFDKSYLQPKGQTFDKELYQQVYDYEINFRNKNSTQNIINTELDDVDSPMPEDYTPEPQGIHDWLEIDARVELGRKNFLQESASVTILPTLREKYKPLGFKFSSRQQAYGFDIVAEAPNGQKIDINLSDDNSVTNLTNFIDSNMPAEDSQEFKAYKANMLARKELNIPNLPQDVLDTIISETLDNKDLFKPIVEETTLPAGQYTYRTEKVTRYPYQVELEQAEKILNQRFEAQFTNNGGMIDPRHRNAIEPPSQQEIEDLARQLVYDNRKREESKKFYYDIFEDLSNEERAKYNLAIRERFQDQDAENLAKDQDAFEAEAVFFDSDPDVQHVRDFENGELNLSDYVPNKDEAVLELKNGRKVPERTYIKYLNAVKASNAKAHNLLNWHNQLETRFNNIESSADKMDILKRDFNIARNFFNNLGLFTTEYLGYGTLRAFSSLARPKIRNYDYDAEAWDAAVKAYNARWKKLDLAMQNFSDTERGKMKEPSKFSDVKLGENFGEFFVHELSQFLPIIASMYGVGALSGGSRLAMFTGMSVPGMGERLKQFTVDAANNPFAEEYSDEYKTLWSAAHGMAEGFWETMTTFPLLQRATRSLSEAGKKGFNTTVREFWLNAPRNVGAAAIGAGGESVGEGMTQITQNWIDERPWIENLDHAMAVGLMFGSGMSTIPIFSGYIGSKLSDAEKFKRVGKLRETKQRLTAEYAGLDKRTTAAKSILSEIKEIDNKIEGEIRSQRNGMLNAEDYDVFKKAILQGFDIRSRIDEVANDNTLSDDVREETLKVLKLAAEMNSSTINDFVGGRVSQFQMLKESNDVKDVKKYNDILNKIKDENPNISDEDAIKLGETTYYYELAENDFKKQKANIKEEGLNINLQRAKSKKDAIAILNKLIKQEQKKESPNTKQIAYWEDKKNDVRSGRENGWITARADGGYDAYVVIDNAVANKKPYTASHEVGHAVTWEALGKKEKEELMPIAKVVLDQLFKSDKKAYDQIVAITGKENYDPTEVMSEFFELVAEEQVNHRPVAPWLSVQLKKTFGLDLNPDIETYNFVLGLGEQIKNGTLKKESLKKKDFKTIVESKSSIRPDLQKAYDEARNILNVEAAKYADNWTPENADKLWEFARNPVVIDKETGEKKKLDKGIFDTYILGKRPDNISKEEIEGYLFDSYVELLNAFRNFKTSNVDKKGRPDIFGWIMGQLGYKTLNVKKRVFEEQKKKSKKVDLDKAKELTAPKQEPKAKQETKDDFAEQINIDPKTISELTRIVTNILGTYQDSITEGATKNVTITPIMSAVNNALTAQYGTIIKYIRTLPGDSLDVQLKFFLKKYMPQILNKVKPSYLSRNFPSLIKKSVGGKFETVRKLDENTGQEKDVKVFIPNYVDDTVWNKKGVKIDREKSAETGRTSGNQLMIKNQSAIDNFNPQDFVNYFFKTVTKKGKEIQQPIQSKYEGLAKELAQRVGRGILNNDLLDKGPISQRFRQTQELYDRVVNENFASVLIAQSDLSNKSSVKVLREVAQNEKEFAHLITAIGFVSRDIAKSNDVYTSAMKYLTQLYNDGLLKDTSRLTRIKKLAKGVETLYQKYLTDTAVVPDEPETFNDFSTYVQAEISQLNFNDLFSAYIKRQGITNKSITELFDYAKNPNLVNKQRAITLQFAQDLVEKQGLEKAIALIYKYFRGHTITAGKSIGKRNQSFAGLQDFVDNVIKLMSPKVKAVVLKTTVNKKGEESQTIQKLIIDRNGKNIDILSEVNKKGEKIIDLRLNSITGKAGMNIAFDKSNKEAKEAEDLMRSFLGYIAKNHDPIDFAMTMASLNSHQSTMLRRAANVYFKYIGPSGIPLKYEHMIPANYMAVKLTDYYINNSKIDIDKLFEQYTVSIIPTSMADLVDTRYESWMHDGWEIGDDTTPRYYNKYFYGIKKIITSKGKIKPVSMYAMEDADGNKYGETYTDEALKVSMYENELVNKSSRFNSSYNFVVAMEKSADPNAKEKGASIIDFDDTLATSNSKIIVNLPAQIVGDKQYGYETWDDGKVKMTSNATEKITPAEFAENSEGFESIGATFDFSEFNEVKDGKRGPFLSKALSLQKKFGSKDMFVLTARPQAAAPAIHKFLKGVGLNMPLENIVGLENGTPEAKADWIVGKVAEGYNNILFADDAIKNTKAVANVLDTFNIGGKIYELRNKSSVTIKASTLDTMLDENNPDSPVVGKKKLSDEEARFYGKPKPWYKILFDLRSKTNLIYVPPSAEDLRGLFNNHIAGKGKKGEADILWFEETIIRPYARGERAMDTLRLLMIDELSNLYNQFGVDFKKDIKREGFSGIFTKQDAIRMYVWDKLGYDIPGSKKSIKLAIEKIKTDPAAMSFANQLLNEVYGKDKVKQNINYVKPNKNWQDGNIENDITSSVLAARKTLYKEFVNNKKAIFTPQNMNKIEAIYGVEFRQAMEDIFFRMEMGVNRSAANMNNHWIKWLNAGVGNIMFINVRSALLQTTSFTNFIDIIGDNNPVAAMARFSDFSTFKKDLLMIWNSKFLRGRRMRGKIDISMNEILEGVDNSKEFFWNLSKKMQELGYKPTQLGDSFAIALGGASFYRNRYNTYIKAGKSKAEAHNRSMRDLRERAEETQQSSRADLISQQQASIAGRIFLSFQNVTMQYTRIGKKLTTDMLKKRRVKKPDGTFYSLNQSRLIQASRLGMYLGYQHLIFQGLQQGILALLAFNDNEEEEKISTKQQVDYLNGIVDSIMRGMGILGGALSVLKNIAIDIYRKDRLRSRNRILDVSPAIKSKYTKAQKIIRGIEKGDFADVLIETPSFVYGLPTDRIVKLIDQIGYGFDLYGQEYEKYQRIMLLLGWNHYNFYDTAPKGGIVNFINNLTFEERPDEFTPVLTNEQQQRLNKLNEKLEKKLKDKEKK